MPPGRPPSLARNLLRNLRIDEIREIVDHYRLPRARSIEDMVETIVRKVGRDLEGLVSYDGPFMLDRWNSFALQLGGQPRRSFEGVREEFARRLDRVVNEFDMDEKLADLREDTTA